MQRVMISLNEVQDFLSNDALSIAARVGINSKVFRACYHMSTRKRTNTKRGLFVGVG